MKIQLITIVFFIISVLSLSAKDIYFRHIVTNNDQPLPSAISIYQDAQGRIWFGNDNFNLYDGENIRTFRMSTYMKGVEDNNIHAICGDGNSFIYFLANKRLIIYNIRTEVFTPTEITARTLCYREDGLYFATNHLLYRYHSDGTQEQVYALPDSAASIRSIYPNGTGWLLGTTKGLFQYEGNTARCLLENTNISCLFIDADKNIWVGTLSDGAKVYKDGQWIAYHEHNSLYPVISNQIRCINQDENKNIWIGTFAGITITNQLLQNTYHLSHNKQVSWSLRHSSIYAICRDEQGGMWVGTYYGGISYFNPDSEHYTYYDADKNDPSKLNGFLFGKITEDNQGNLYIATEDGGLNSLNKQSRKIKRFDSVPSVIPCSTSKSVWYDTTAGCLYIGTFLKGLLLYTPATGLFRSIGEDWLTSDPQRVVTDLIPWKEWLIVITQEGLYKLNRKTQTLSPLFTDPALQAETNGTIRSAYLDTQERLWIVPAYKEMKCIDLVGNRELPITALQSAIAGKTVQNITGDQNGNLFLLTFGSGLLKYKPESGQIDYYNQEQSNLLTNSSYRVVVIRQDRLLITSARGLTLLDPEKKESTHILLKECSPLHTLNTNCGVYVSPSDSTIFIGGVEGVVSIKEEGLRTSNASYKIEFNSLSINNTPIYPSTAPQILKKSITYTSDLTLPYDKNNVTIGFSSTNYRHTEKNLFEYKLEGRDKQWTRTRHKIITYTTLPPGKYKLVVREAGGQGKQISIQIRILPPFYASIYACCFYGIILLLFLWWLIRFNRSRAVLKASLEMEHREKLHIEELNQMKLKFYINISHELRTPLTLIISQLDLVLQNNDLIGNLRNKLDKIRRHTYQMQQLITEILDFRRLEQGKMPLHASQQNLVAFMKSISDSFREYAIIHHIHYNLETADDEIKVWFDPVQMQKVFNNLLSNAFKFTPDNGTISVCLQRRNESAEIIITDTGCGIAAEHLEHIFDRFYQAENPSGIPLSGSGIGLALTREVVIQHKGQISVISEPDKGTRFTVTLLVGETHFTTEQKTTESIPTNLLPYQPKIEDLSIPILPEEKTANEGNQASILLVEDNEDLLQVLEEALSLTFNVYKARDGQEGVQMAEEYIPDLIISDVMMPRLSGTEMCRQLKRKLETSHIPVILLTARVSQEQAIEGLKCGANDYIVKPFHMEILLLKCHNIIRTARELQVRFQTEARIPPTELTTNRLDKQLLEDSIRIIETNLETNDFNIDIWCREIAIGRTRLAGKIKSITGLTLNDFILQIKLRKCAVLLTDEKELTISEIAWKSGFSSAGYMGKCFKEQFGVTPIQYRNRDTD